MSDILMDRLLDVVEATDFETPAARDEEFVNVGLGMLSLAISRLAPAEREALLADIEDDLRKAVKQFESCRRFAPDASGRLQ
jgi:hypothetical protein